MKDSYNNQMEKQLADKGWANMQKLLDRDMPVERKRRRGIVWMYQLAAALLLPALGIGAWSWLEHQQPDVDPVIASGEHMPAVEYKQPATGTSQAATHTGAAETYLLNPPASGEQKQMDASSGTTAYQHSTLQTTNQDTPSALFDQSLNNTGKATSTLNVNGQQTFGSLNTSTPEAPQNLQVLGQPESRVSSQQQRQVVFPNTLSMPESMATIEPQSVKAPQQAWAFGAGAGIQSSTDFDGLNGAVAGLNVDYNINRHFGLRSGLNYQAFQPDNSERPIASISTTSYTEATGFEDFNPGSFGTASVNMQVDVPIARLHRVEAPLLAYWQPIRMLRMFGGVRFGYNVYAQSAQRAQTEFGAFDTPENGKEARSLNRSVSETLPNWDPSWSGGLGIGIGKRAEIGLFYNHPWKSGKNEETLDSFLPGPATNAGNAKPGKTNASSFQVSATVFF